VSHLRDHHGGRRVRPRLLGDKFLPDDFYNTLPLPVVAGVVAAILYGVVATLWRSPQAGVSVETVTGTASDFPSVQQRSTS
jgi:hypothetical protein